MGHFLSKGSSLPASQSVSESVSREFSTAGKFQSPRDTGNSGLVESMRNVLAHQNPENIIEHLRASRKSSYQKAMLPLVMQLWADHEPEAAVRYASEMEAAEGRLELTAIALESMAKSDLDSALKWVEQTDTIREQEFLYAAVYAGYAEHHPREAMLAVQKMIPGHGRDQATAKIAEVWAETDARAVFDWIETQSVNRDLHEVYGMAMVEYIRQDPDDAGLVIRELSPGDQKTVLACQYTHLLAESDIGRAMDWVESLPEGPAKQQSMGLVVEAWFDVDSERAFEFARSGSEEQQAELLKRVALKMAMKDPVAATGSLNQFPATFRPSAAKDMAIIWAGRDPGGVVNWIAGLRDANVHEQAVRGAIHPLLDRSPDVAFQLAASTSGQSRYHLMQQTAGRWYEIDPGAAMEALETDRNLSVSQKQKIIAEISTKGTLVDILLP